MSGHLTYSVTSSAHVNATPQRVYGIIADYHHGHPRILPSQFRRVVVERGGTCRVLGGCRSDRICVKGGFALDCSGPLATH